MKYKITLLLALIIFYSCEDSKQEKKEIVVEEQIVSKNKTTEKGVEEIQTNLPEVENKISDCVKFWKNRFISDSLIAVYIDEIISKKTLTKNNLNFLNALKSQKENDLVFKNVLAPIFRLSNSEIGIFSFPTIEQIDNKFRYVSKEIELIENFDTITNNTMEHFGKIRFYPMLLNSLFKNNSKPSINYYTTSKVGSTKILELGSYQGECLDYHEYSIDTTHININDKLLFSSPFKIDLVFENNKKIDSLIKSDYRKECFDCPNSIQFQKTFAKIKGTDNLYFIYADTFPINNELDTPSRALILISQDSKVIYLWYEEIDLFGCSCL
uniref:hypothetical protein n=1 Tax=Flavobacterium sp. TaxID=239 RepID=UPI00404B5C81